MPYDFLFKPKPLNSRSALVPLMESAGYVGQGYTTYERSKLASRGISVIAGLAAIVGATYSVAAQEPQPIAYKNTNLAQYGVPSVDGIRPASTRYRDLTDRLPGKETRVDLYRLPNALIVTFSVSGVPFQVGYDRDFKPPTDVAYRDEIGNGVFSKYDPDAPVKVPNWLIR